MKMMKNSLGLILSGIFTLAVTTLFSQPDTIVLPNQVLTEIAIEGIEKSKEFDKTIRNLDARLLEIDSILYSSNSDNGKIIEQLQERIMILEQRESTHREKEVYLYVENYQTAVVNLIGMELDLKPLVLFTASKDFYNQLNTMSNPTTYEGFDTWFKVFKDFIEREKEKDAILQITSKVLNTAGEFASAAGITGVISDCLLSSVSKFIESLGGGRNSKLRKQSIEMLELIMTLSQYTTDKNLVENEWVKIEKELDELAFLQQEIISETFKLLNISKDEFDARYVSETNSDKRYAYVTEIRNEVKKKVHQDWKDDKEPWRDHLYNSMLTIQSLKIRFGQTTSHILAYIQGYKDLVNKYKYDKYLGPKISNLETKLFTLEGAFKDTFNPQKYISDAHRMYKVH